jgi:hypothetical protein
MARIKCSPRVAQPDPEPLLTPEPSQVKTPASDDNPSTTKQVIKDNDKSSIDSRVRSKLSIATEQEETVAMNDPAIAVQTSEAEQGFAINPKSNMTDLICPQCDSRFPEKGIKVSYRIPYFTRSRDIGVTLRFLNSLCLNLANIIQGFREHVESCTRRTTGDSESTASSLSPPPDYLNADDGADADDEEDYLRPYEKNAMTWYPESHVDPVVDDIVEGADGQQKIPLPKITDASKFVDSIEDFEEMPYDELYLRCQAAQLALVAWQNEFIDIDQYIRITEPAAPGKEHKNPRMPKPHLTGVGYQDQLEAYAYGYEYNSHHSAVGNQNPLKQRITNAGNGGRELRQRVPTQKAAEADQSTTPDSDEGATGRRRGRPQKIRDQIVDGDLTSGPGSRGRNTSRFNSESRGQTPQKTFPSGKTIGRPRTKGNKSAGGSRLKEVQLDHDGSQNDSTPEPAQSEYGGFMRGRANPTTELERGLKQPLQTTEQWDDETEQEDVLLRPSTSDSTVTGNSTDDMRTQPLRASTRNRKRANTSDFEDALPASKRFGRKPGNTQTNGLGGMGATNLGTEGTGSGVNTSKRRTRLEENNEIDWLTGADESRQKKQRGKANKSSEDMRAAASMTSGVAPSTAADSSSTNAGAMDMNLDSIKKTGKDGSKPSRASLNMMRRWAAKKKAEALGLPVPKIGRYPKGGSAPSTPNVVGTPDLNDSSNNVGGRKRKRDDFEASPANTGDAGNFLVGTVTKGRGGRPKKVTNAEFAPPANPAEQENDQEGNVADVAPLDNDQGQVDSPAAAPVPKRKGGRPKKNVVTVQPETQADAQTRVQSEFLTEDQAAAAGDAIAAEYGREGEIEEDIPTPVKSRGGRPRKVAVTAPTSSGETNTVNEEKGAEGSSQPPVPRTSGRIRRQTSAATSSQADTRPSSRSSKVAITPTPMPISAPASVQQPTEDPAIKQEPVTGPILPKKKRGRQPKSATTEMVAESSHVLSQDTEGVMERPTKRRRVAQETNSASAENTPFPVTVPGNAQNHHATMASTEDAEIDSAAAGAGEAAQYISSDAPPMKKKRGGGRPRKIFAGNAPAVNHVADAQPTPDITPAPINVDEDNQDTSSDVPASNTRGGKGSRKASTRRVVAENVASDDHSTPEIARGSMNASEGAKGTSIGVLAEKKRGGYRPRNTAAADAPTEDVESEIEVEQEVSPTKKRRPGRPAKRARGFQSGNTADIEEAADETATKRTRALGRGGTMDTEESAETPPMTRSSRRVRANSTQAASADAAEIVEEQPQRRRILRLKTNSKATSDAIAAITGEPSRPTIPEPKNKGTWGGKRVKGISASIVGPDSTAISEAARTADVSGRENGIQPIDFSGDEMHAASEPARKSSIGRARGKRLASNMGGQSGTNAFDLGGPIATRFDTEAAGDVLVIGSSAQQPPKITSARKGRLGGKGGKEKAVSDTDGSEDGKGTLIAKVEPVDEEAAPEMDAAAKKKEAARLSKAEKMRESMKSEFCRSF